MQKAQQNFELNSHVCLELPSEIEKEQFQDLKTEEKVSFADKYITSIFSQSYSGPQED